MNAEKGSAVVAMAGALAIIAVLSVAVAGLGTLYAARAKAQVAADAASLAAAVATYPPASERLPRASANDVARRNGAVILGCRCPRNESLSVRTVEVVTGVTVDVPVFGRLTVRGSSRAEFDPLLWLGAEIRTNPSPRTHGPAADPKPGPELAALHGVGWTTLVGGI